MKKILSAIVCFCLIVSCFSAYGAEMVEAPSVKEKIKAIQTLCKLPKNACQNSALERRTKIALQQSKKEGNKISLPTI